MDFTTTITATLDLLAYALGFFFALWWVLIPSVIGRNPGKTTRMLVMWLVLAFVRILILFKPESTRLILIPEPLNTTLFLLVGVVLIVFWFVLRQRQKAIYNRKKEQVQSLNDLLNLSPTEFEDMVADIYRMAGHQARRTGTTGDNGVDIIIQERSGEKWVVQCKRWRGSVGASIVRDFYGAMHHEKADKGIIVTTGNFTRQAKEWAKGKPIILYDGEKLLELWKRTRKQNPQKLPTTS